MSIPVNEILTFLEILFNTFFSKIRLFKSKNWEEKEILSKSVSGYYKFVKECMV